jgi:enoyl-CoA hydratase/carnithine racemase
MLGEPILAPAALQMGLVNRVSPDAASARADAQALARRLARGPSFALGMTKTMLTQEMNMSLEQALEAEAQAQQICMHTEDFHEAHAAFVGKREPIWKGR